MDHALIIIIIIIIIIITAKQKSRDAASENVPSYMCTQRRFAFAQSDRTLPWADLDSQECKVSLYGKRRLIRTRILIWVFVSRTRRKIRFLSLRLNSTWRTVSYGDYFQSIVKANKLQREILDCCTHSSILLRPDHKQIKVTFKPSVQLKGHWQTA